MLIHGVHSNEVGCNTKLKISSWRTIKPFKEHTEVNKKTSCSGPFWAYLCVRVCVSMTGSKNVGMVSGINWKQSHLDTLSLVLIVDCTHDMWR